MRNNLEKAIVFDETSPIYFLDGADYDAEREFLSKNNSNHELIGETIANKYNSTLTILDYKNYTDVVVGVDTIDGKKYNRYGCTLQNFRNAQISSPFERRVQGFGYIGEGEFGTRENLYFFKLFTNMINRVYNENVHVLKPGYIGSSVHYSWDNFQNFCYWCNSNYYEMNSEVMDLDKDLLYKKNKEYGPNTCVFLPQSINKLFLRNSIANKRGLPRGIEFVYGKTRPYKVSLSHNRQGISSDHLGYYDTLEEAFNVYKVAKEAEIKRVADDYWFNKGGQYIPQFKRVYDAMYAYTIDIDD